MLLFYHYPLYAYRPPDNETVILSAIHNVSGQLSLSILSTLDQTVTSDLS